ncbi:hypothetical protein ACHQM5_013352 [Ranunculus cassubicifolius]
MASGSEEGLGFGSEDENSSSASTTHVELLKRAWRNEKASPEILQFEPGLVQQVRKKIQKMEDTVAEYENNSTDPLTVSLYQMDLDRTQFLLRSYLRIRLQKIEKYMLYITKSAEMRNRLSKQEQKFAESCKDNIEKHLTQSVLSKLPPAYKSIWKQFISSEEDDMVPEPELETFVFCKIKETIGSYQIGSEIMDLVEDDLWVMPYKVVKPLMEKGQIDMV